MGRAFEYADGVGGRRRAAVIRAATGDDVIIGEQELRHAMRHFTLPRDLVLSLITRVLANPTIVLGRRCAQTARVPVVLPSRGRALLARGRQAHAGRRILRKHVPYGTQHSAVAPPVQEGAAMRKSRISFRHFSGSGPLSIYWHDGPYGDAVEAVKGRGVAWLAPNGELLGVEFDDVARAADAQTLELPNGDVVTVRVKKGKVTVRQRHRARRTSAA